MGRFVFRPPEYVPTHQSHDRVAWCKFPEVEEVYLVQTSSETISHGGSDKVLLRRLDEIFAQYEIDTIVVGMPLNMDGTAIKVNDGNTCASLASTSRTP